MTERYVVSFDRWDATQRENERRLAALERHSEALSGAEAEHRSLAHRLAVLEQAEKTAAASERGRRDRAWTVVLLVAGSLILPILTTAIITYLHLKTYH